MFESYNSCGREGVFYFLGGVLLKTDDTHVHFMYIEAAKVGNLQGAEREDEHFPKRVADFHKEVHLLDQRPCINVCDRFMVDRPNAPPLLEQHVRVHMSSTVSPMEAPQVAGALIDADCSEDFVRALILSVRPMAPSEQLVKEVESRLEARLNEDTRKRQRCTKRS